MPTRGPGEVGDEMGIKQKHGAFETYSVFQTVAEQVLELVEELGVLNEAALVAIQQVEHQRPHHHVDGVVGVRGDGGLALDQPLAVQRALVAHQMTAYAATRQSVRRGMVEGCS